MFGIDDLSSCEIFHLIAKNQFTSSIGCEDLEERDVLLQVLQSLEFMHELHVGNTGFKSSTCSCRRSSFLFHSQADMTAAQIMLTASGSDRPCFLTFSLSSEIISFWLWPSEMLFFRFR